MKNSKNITKTSAQKKYPITEKTINRRFCAENVTREEISVGQTRGVLFKPEGPGPFKGIIDIYGGGGGLMEIKAPLFASHGFAAMVLPYFNYKDLPKTINESGLDPLMEGINYLASREDISPGIGLAGLCVGGSIVLRLASESEYVSAVVNINGGYSPFPMKLNGVYLPTPEDFQRYAGTNENERGVFFIMKGEDIPERMKVKIEKSSANFLIILGEADVTFDKKNTVRRYIDRMEHYGKGDQVMCLSYPGAGHIIQPPYIPQTFTYYTRTYDMVHGSGGEVVDNAMACIHSWREILNFFQENTGINV